MARQVTLSAKAYADIDRIVEFNNVKNQSETYSKKFIKNLYLQFQKLKKYPTIGVKTVEPDTYVLIWDLYYIFYQLNKQETIQIISIYHQKENVSR